MVKYAVPLLDGILCEHFGHCEEFAFIEADPQTKKITKTEQKTPPPHEPGVLPKWLMENSVNVAIVGGMGMRAQQLLREQGVRVIIGAPSAAPDILVQQDLNAQLQNGDNTCGHGPDHVCDGNHSHHGDHKHHK